MVKTQIFPGQYKSLEEISKFVKENARNAGFDGFTAYTIETAVDEACSNVIEHAYGQEDIGDIEISIDDSLTSLTILIVDHGKPFNPKSVPNPNMASSLYERKGSGLGIYMMKQWMDEVHFEFLDTKNVLKLVKKKGN
jgi:serine/threonine-protein kinase RsbW